MVAVAQPRRSRDPASQPFPRPGRRPAGGGRALEPEARGRRSTRGPVRRAGAAPHRPRTCRSCGAELDTAAQKARGRCDECPATCDEELFERLRAWRLAAAKAQSVPAFVVFTDATLTAIAETVPSDTRGLSAIAGVGTRKLDQYGAQVLAVLGGADPDQVVAAAAPDEG